MDLTVVNPIGVPPWPLSRREPYSTWATTPALSSIGGAPVHHVRFLSLPRFADGNPARIVAAVLPLIRQLHAEQPFDLIDAQFFFSDGPAAAAIADALGLPLSIKARGSDIQLWTTRPWARRQILAAAERADGLLAVSGALARDMAAMGMSAARIAVHPTGLDYARFRVTPRDAARADIAPLFTGALPPGEPLYLSVGALIPAKGMRLTIDALALLGREMLALAGTGSDEAALRSYAAALGLTERVRFLGQVDHDRLPQLLSAADVLVHPSEREGIANVWIEALARGTPVVATEVGGAREVIDHPDADRVVARDPAAMARAIVDLSVDPPPQSHVAAHAARFTWEANAAALVAHSQRLATR